MLKGRRNIKKKSGSFVVNPTPTDNDSVVFGDMRQPVPKMTDDVL